MVQETAVRYVRFEAGLRYRLENFLSQSFQRKDKAAKAAGWASPFICCGQDTVVLKPPLPLRLLGLGKPTPFYLL